HIRHISVTLATHIALPHLPSSPTRRSSDLPDHHLRVAAGARRAARRRPRARNAIRAGRQAVQARAAEPGRASNLVDLPVWHFERSEEHTSALQSREELVCRLLLDKKRHTQT